MASAPVFPLDSADLRPRGVLRAHLKGLPRVLYREGDHDKGPSLVDAKLRSDD
jgi:hypothetical protein